MNRAHAGDNPDSAIRLSKHHLQKRYWRYKREGFKRGPGKPGKNRPFEENG